METSWRDRKNSLDITALDAAVKAVIDVDLSNGKIPKIMKRHYKENFVRYDIGIGTVGHKDAESYEKTVAGPVFDTIKERAVKNGWKAFYQPSYGSRGSVAWMDYYVQLRIPYDNTTTIQEGTCINSIYEQMNNIDDKESLDEKYNVGTLKDLKKLNETGSVDRLYSATDLIGGEYEEIPNYPTVPRSTWDGKWVLAYHNGNDWIFYTRGLDFDSDISRAARFASRSDALRDRAEVNKRYKRLTDYRANFIAVKSNSKQLQED